MTHIARLFFQFNRLLGASPIGNGHINDTYRLDYEVAGAHKTALLQRLNH
ncbi:MAG: mucin desulfatase, partial [Phycisphaerae bacterium]|nr:mucin desulfatase [Saprospiraceae bacterium]